MADVEVTLNHSENYSSSTAKTYRGYVINLCDDSHVDDGTWSPSTYDGIGVSIDENKINVWNTNITGSSVSNTFTWTSSKVSGCTKTLKVTVPGAVVTLKSGNTEIVVTATYDNSGIVYNTSYEDEFLINGSSEGIVTTLSVLTGETITTCNGDMDRYWSNYIQSTSNTNKMNFGFNHGLNTHLIGCSDNYNSSGSYTINLKYYDREMTISFPVTFNLTYNGLSEYVIIFKKGELPIEFIESKLMPTRYTFDVYYRPKDSFEEQSASGIITSVSSSSTYYTATFIGNTITLAQKIGSIGDVFPDDIEFDVNVCIKPSNASSDICNSLPVHFTKESSGGSSKSITINWSVSYPDGLMIYNYNTSIDVGLTNYVNSDATSGSIPIDFAPYITSRDISVNFSLQSAGYLGSLENKYKGKSVKVLIDCSGFMMASSSSGNNTGCCLSSSGTAVMLTPTVDFTSNFDNVSITDGLVINIDIKLTVI